MTPKDKAKELVHRFRIGDRNMKSKAKQCNHKWKIPLMYNKNNYYNPTECVKCGKSILNLFDNRVNWRGQRIFKPNKDDENITKDSMVNQKVESINKTV